MKTIELMRGDFAIPALKRALAKGIGNAGEPVSIHQIGVSGTMVPSLRKNPKNVQRATKKYWGEDEGLDNATASMRYNRDWAAKTIKEDRLTRKFDPNRYKWKGFPRRLVGEETLPEPLQSERMRSRMGLRVELAEKDVVWPDYAPQWHRDAARLRNQNARKAAAAGIKKARLEMIESSKKTIKKPVITPEFQRAVFRKVFGKVKLSSLTPGMIAFADPRPRNDMGQYMANETGGADPNSMAAAYGNVEQEKAMRRKTLVQRLKSMIAG
jgi:hypothetical protein